MPTNRRDAIFELLDARIQEKGKCVAQALDADTRISQKVVQAVLMELRLVLGMVDQVERERDDQERAKWEAEKARGPFLQDLDYLRCPTEDLLFRVIHIPSKTFWKLKYGGQWEQYFPKDPEARIAKAGLMFGGFT